MADVNGYVNKKQETDLPYFAGGLIVTGLLLTAVPLCLPKNNDVVRLIRTGTAFIAVIEMSVAGCFWRRIHKYLIPQWEEIEAIEAEYKSKQLDLEASEQFEKELSLSVARAVGHATQTLEASVKPLPNSDTPPSQPNQQQLERMFYEGDDRLRSWLKENGFFDPEKRSKTPQHKGLGDSGREGRPTDGRPEPLAENEADGQLDGQPTVDDLERVRVLVQMAGMKLPDAIKKVTGKDSGHRQYKTLRKAYLERYGES